MSILHELGLAFPPQIQERGDQYFGQHRVQIVENRLGYIRAIVRGTGRYRVEITWNNGDVLNPEYRCGCPYFHEHGGCKHIWAVLKQAEHERMLPLLDRVDKPSKTNGNGLGPDAPTVARRDDTQNDPGEVANDDEEYNDEQAVESHIERVRRIASSSSQPEIEEGALARTRPRWQRTLDTVRDQMQGAEGVAAAPWPAHRRIVYVVDVAATLDQSMLAIELMCEDVLVVGKPERLRSLRLSRVSLPKLPDADDAAIVQMLLGASRGGVVEDYLDVDHRFLLAEATAESLLRRMIVTGRCRLRHHESSSLLPNLQWDESPPWKFVLRLQPDEREPIFWLRGDFRRDDEIIDASESAIVLRGGLMIRGDTVSKLDDGGAFDLIALLRSETNTFVPEAQIPALLGELFSLPRLPQLDLPAGYELTEARVTPRPKLTIARPGAGPANRLIAELNFDYAGAKVPWRPLRPAMYDAASARLLWRDRDLELASGEMLTTLGLRPSESHLNDDTWRLPANKLGRIVSALVSHGWLVEAEGKLYRRGGKFNVRVASGIDWLELSGGIDFDGESATLPQLLAAAKSGEKLIQLGDGTFGVLPEDWLQQYGLLASMGEVDGEQIKFSKKQVGLLDALLATVPEATWDESFAKLRKQLDEFSGIAAAEAPAEFIGELRHYQKDGLGWITFLRELGFGGCLADDMGLGKTIQVLAMLQQRKVDGTNKPSLVVVPRSLIFNWVAEAEKFTPNLRVLDHSGAQRSIPKDGFKSFDLVLSTYGTVRRDAAEMKDIPFDYIVLDEAQAIKNSQSESAKAVRILNGSHRLALSGTPVQNHLGELWSLFEFLNPGLLGTTSAFKAISTGGSIEGSGREVLSKALRPFILRRTKAQVAPELPDKLEQTLHCELDKEQRQLYNELREHYRVNLLQQVDQQGIGKSKMLILEALLRLRQAACHPGLIDKSRVNESSAKLDALIPQVEEVIDEGHKVLVFSQFTSFLSIVRKKLDARGVIYEYLDGKTTDRQARVRRFQNDPDCKLFLISLKAGGLGLNLTQAEYVFLLDPWWNPSVEQQAIDRTHRIGQTRQVFAYRLIAKDTVEEKVLELQKAKRALADAIITADNSLISSMGREELEMLLS